MDKRWPAVVQRIVQVLGIQAGDLVLVRDAAGRFDVLLEIALAIEAQGATPLIELVPAEYRQRLWNEVPRAYLTHWDRHRSRWVDQAACILTLAGAEPDWDVVSHEGFRAWEQAIGRLTVAEEARALPATLVAVPTTARAKQLGLSLESLEAILLPALLASAQELQAQVDRVLDAVKEGQTIAIHSGVDHVLHLRQGDRPWHRDEGRHHCNLPAGSIHTTVLETETEGSLWLPEAGGATDVVLHFAQGRIERIEAASGAEALNELFDEHSGEPRRVSHVGLGLNPYLRRPIGWTLVDEHILGALFIA
ncbi:MAG: aminopeptidase, partial [Anaerolineae bacterium]|nr:aminopeptidase [Anaerolineae bacterium]